MLWHTTFEIALLYFISNCSGVLTPGILERKVNIVKAVFWGTTRATIPIKAVKSYRKISLLKFISGHLSLKNHGMEDFGGLGVDDELVLETLRVRKQEGSVG